PASDRLRRAARAVRKIRQQIRDAGSAVAMLGFQVDASRPPDEPLHVRICAARDALEGKLPEFPRAVVRGRLRWSPVVVIELHEETALDSIIALPEIEWIEPDVPGAGAALDPWTYTGATAAHALGYRGGGATAAVLDSGLDFSHPAFEGAVVHVYHFLDQGRDAGPGQSGAWDRLGHGTNVAGILASRGGDYPEGAAPEAKLVIVKVLSDANRGWLSDWAQGVDHVVALKAEDGLDVDVINMSLLTFEAYSSECDGENRAITVAVRSAVERGIALFAASGNGARLDALTLPACISWVISVGSIRGAEPESLSWFTDRAPFLDLLAPGESVRSTGLVSRGGYSTYSGTSQAAPQAAGAACLLAQAAPASTPARLRRLLLETGPKILDEASGLTFPILDSRAALEAALAPDVTGLRCRLEGGALSVQWTTTATGAPAAYRVTVMKDGYLSVQRDVAARRPSFSVQVDEAGAYEVSVQALSAEGFLGLAEVCTSVVADAGTFVRGDCSSSGQVDAADSIRLLETLFLGEDDPPCWEACDANDDGRPELADAVYLLEYLYLGAAPPPVPFPECGVDPTPPNAGCERARCQ
ncbi:MAG TPA: S8 family serine peptidase, partial [Planctomycetota bacterium]|nr:S8 family serine peptidase [Planctomycetota bacterium]